MKCPLCNVEMAINASRYKVDGDNSSETETKLYIEQDIVCRNKNCTNFGKVVKTIKNPLQLSKD